MPDGFTLEDFQYQIFVLQKLEKAEEQLEQGCKTYSVGEMRILRKECYGEKEKKIEKKTDN
ncbi:MAG: hypothetical protein ACTSRI_17135 [Promethearchaeota archaeon]